MAKFGESFGGEKSKIEKAEEEVDLETKEITRNDIEKGLNFLKSIYQAELEEGKEVTSEIVEENFSHTQRVAENARWIAKGEKLDEAKLELAGIFHDSGKLNSELPGGIDTFGHHLVSTPITSSFLTQLKKSPELKESIINMIARHSFIPFIRKENPKVPAPMTWEDFALRDADQLDEIDIWGIKKIIEIRQNPKSVFYKEDKGKFQNALNSALQSREEAIKLLVTPTAKKIAEGYEARSQKLLEKVKQAKVKNLKEFNKIFDQFLAAERK
jgi:HD superfamily phosphodiesterase